MVLRDVTASLDEPVRQNYYSNSENQTMLYLGIDQHAKQLTVSLRNDDGETVLRRQVSTQPAKIDAFFQKLKELHQGQGFMAILEVCGFNDWLIERLDNEGCQEVVLIHPDKRSKQKTDRRDAHKLAETLWLNRLRLTNAQKPQGIRRVLVPSVEDTGDRSLTTLRKNTAKQKTRIINKVKRILHRYNRMWECPTKTFQTQASLTVSSSCLFASPGSLHPTLVPANQNEAGKSDRKSGCDAEDLYDSLAHGNAPGALLLRRTTQASQAAKRKNGSLSLTKRQWQRFNPIQSAAKGDPFFEPTVVLTA